MLHGSGFLLLVRGIILFPALCVRCFPLRVSGEIVSSGGGVLGNWRFKDGGKGGQTEGPDSKLYEGFGSVRDSERESGLTRPKKPKT